MNKLHRHGEIILIKIDSLPKEARLVKTGKEIMVGHSESGHHHVMTLDKTATADLRMFEFEGKTYLDIPLEAKLIHQKEMEKHATQTFEKGVYEFHPRQSYNYAEKIMKRVID